jgi:hypothetical protein
MYPGTRSFHSSHWFRRVLAVSIVVLAVFLLRADTRFYGQSRTICSEGDPLPSISVEDASSGAEASSNLTGLRTSAHSGSASFIGPFFARSAQEKSSKVTTLGSVKVDSGVEGFGFDDNATENGGVVAIPPDPHGAAGNSGIIAIGNFIIEARNKGGHLVWRDALGDFFAPVSPLMPTTFDPKIIYDQYEDRFVVVWLDLVFSSPRVAISTSNISRILVAVSKDGNPKTPTAADWHYHAINAKTLIGTGERWADYPGLAIDEEAIYITANMFSFAPPSRFGGVRLWIIGKGASGGFYDGGAASVAVHDPYASAGIITTTQPAHVFGDGGAGLGIGTYLVSYSGITDTVDNYVQIVRVDNPLTAPTFSQQFVNIGNIESFPQGVLLDAPQSGTARVIEVFDRRALNAVWRDNALWMTADIRPNSGPDLNQTTAHWWNLNTTAPAVVTPNDQGNIGGEDIAPGAFTFYPAVAVNRDGFAAFGFSASAPTIFAGAYVTGRAAGDAPGSVRSSEVVHEGVDYYVRAFSSSTTVSSRWGDYTGIAVDPTSNDFFWVFNEFADQRGSVLEIFPGEDGRWRTAWARYRAK